MGSEKLENKKLKNQGKSIEVISKRYPRASDLWHLTSDFSLLGEGRREMAQATV